MFYCTTNRIFWQKQFFFTTLKAMRKKKARIGFYSLVVAHKYQGELFKGAADAAAEYNADTT